MAIQYIWRYDGIVWRLLTGELIHLA